MLGAIISSTYSAAPASAAATSTAVRDVVGDRDASGGGYLSIGCSLRSVCETVVVTDRLVERCTDLQPGFATCDADTFDMETGSASSFAQTGETAGVEIFDLTIEIVDLPVDSRDGRANGALDLRSQSFTEARR